MFNNHFPYYLTLGMTSDEYWHGRFELVKAYRESYELKQKMKDYELWKQGMYFYEALLDVSPILHAFAKNGTKPRPYSDKPYGVKEETNEQDEKQKIENERIKAKLHFANLTRLLNKQFGDKKDG